MLMKQIYTIINGVTSEILGKTEVVNEDLSNIVDVGTEIFGTAASVDNYVHSLVDHVGKVVFVDRKYSGSAPSVFMDGWEYGSIVEKIQMDTPVATENESWSLTNGETYDPNVFSQPTVTAKFFNKRVTFEIPISITEKQVKSAFDSASDMNAFLSMIYNAIEKSMTIKTDALIMRTLNNMIGETIHDEYGATALAESSKMRAVNLLYLYNQTVTTDITVAECMYNTDFLKFASYQMALYSDRIKSISTLFNAGGKDRFTSLDMQKIVLLSQFAKSADVYLQSSTFHQEFTALPNADTVSYWQGSGTDYSFTSASKIDVKTASGATVATSGILGVIFDKDALGVTNLDRRTTTQYNAKGEFFNNFYKFDAGYFNDTNENFVVFFVA